MYGVGVGPGDPRLLTLRAIEVMQGVSTVIVPRSRGDRDSLALSIARPHLLRRCEILDAILPMTEDREVLEKAWDETAVMMIAQALGGKSVAFLTLGDAMLYSTWSYVLRALRRRMPGALVKTIPGITAMSACAAATGVPLAEGRAPLIIWPDAPPEDTAALLKIAPNLVFMKASRHLGALAEIADVSTVAVRRCSMSDEQTTRDLRSWEDDGEYFTTVLMHAEEGE